MDNKLSRGSRRRRQPDPRFDQPAVRNCGSMAEIGEVLRTRRKEHRYTQAEMAQICNFSPRLIGEIERGRGTVGIDKVIKYAHWLGVDILTNVRGKEGRHVDQ